VRKLAALTSHLNQVHEELGGTDTVLTLEAAQQVVAERDVAVREREEARENLRGWMDGSAKAVKQSVKRVHEWLDQLGAETHADYEVRFASAVARLAACELETEDAKAQRDEVIAACRGTMMDDAGLRKVDRMARKLAACERVVEAARAVVLDARAQHGYDQYAVGTATIDALRAAVTAETQE